MFNNMTWPVACVFNVQANIGVKMGGSAEAEVELIKAVQEETQDEPVEEVEETSDALATT